MDCAQEDLLQNIEENKTHVQTAWNSGDRHWKAHEQSSTDVHWKWEWEGPSLVMWGQGAHILEDIEVEDNELTRFHRRLNKAKQHAWSWWQREYLHSLMESHRVRRLDVHVPEVRERVLILVDEKDWGRWKKGEVIWNMRGVDGVARGVIWHTRGSNWKDRYSLCAPWRQQVQSMSQNKVLAQREGSLPEKGGRQL